MKRNAKRLIAVAVVALASVSLASCGPDSGLTSFLTPVSGVASATPTVAPTATPVPTAIPLEQQSGTMTLSDMQATDLAIQALATVSNTLPMRIENPVVTFSRENVSLAVQLADQGGVKLEVQGTPTAENDRLSFKLTALKLNGIEVPFYRDEVENAINTLFEQMLTSRRVQSVQLGDGTLTVVLNE